MFFRLFYLALVRVFAALGRLSRGDGVKTAETLVSTARLSPVTRRSGRYPPLTFKTHAKPGKRVGASTSDPAHRGTTWQASR